jgi:error-prone DNA polymerase
VQAHAEAIAAARAQGLFTSFTDFVRRTGLRAGALKKLGQADAFGSLPLARREALWRALPEREQPTLFDRVEVPEEPAPLPPMSPFAEVLADYGAAGLTLRKHPVSFLRKMLDDLGITPANQLVQFKHGRRMKVAGVVLLRQRPSTAKGVTFVTLEDETGTVNLIVQREVWERNRRVARGATAMIAHGTLQTDGEVTHILVTKMEDLSPHVAELVLKSRDFH